jgi:hypothetical protein
VLSGPLTYSPAEIVSLRANWPDDRTGSRCEGHQHTPDRDRETPRRGATVEDAPTLFDLVGGADRVEITEHLIWDGPDHLSETREFVEKVRAESYGANGFHWVIRDRDGLFTAMAGAALGMIGTRPSGEPGRGDVAYWLGKPHWGRGINDIRVEFEDSDSDARFEAKIRDGGMRVEIRTD